jgi:hypothetical protein
MRRPFGSLVTAATCGAAALSLCAAAQAGAATSHHRDHRARHVGEGRRHNGQGPSHGSPNVQVVATGLNSPKHLRFGPGGLYVAESGTGGPGPTGPNCVAAVGNTGAPTTFCEGPTASVAVITPFGTKTVLSGLPSVTEEDTQETLGGLGETTFDSDPYDIVPYRGGYAIADAAANAVRWLSPFGHLSTIAQLPTTPETVPAGVLGPTAMTIDAQAVPTSIAVGRDGALYVGTLRGVPSLPGTADVYRVVPGQAPVAAVTGLSAVTDVAFDQRGRLLVLEYNTGGLLAPPTTPGALLRVTLRGSHAPVVDTLPVSGLFSPTGLAVGPGRQGAVYVANHGTSPGSATPSGEVLRITGLG